MDNMFYEYPDVVDVSQLQEMLGGKISRKLLYRILKNQDIKNRKIGREYRIPKNNIIDYLSR